MERDLQSTPDLTSPVEEAVVAAITAEEVIAQALAVLSFEQLVVINAIYVGCSSKPTVAKVLGESLGYPYSQDREKQEKAVNGIKTIHDTALRRMRKAVGVAS